MFKILKNIGEICIVAGPFIGYGLKTAAAVMKAKANGEPVSADKIIKDVVKTEEE